ncbi:TetR/AcrR family transcriptional regulator [Streptomyces lunaelactis]|uniref:TetR/AcrR family transcriptional regulator n=1 Tax=Streptomyces lunaelactis TaxID=1535768 RepID=UPI00158457BE|nr:WHG domain-containing protein [Streptomyces lunaelactis]NUK07079.1 TetR/AcrR family transcriptional regulator [Streptomyces lunaelactis]NUK17220.1 TetR/AcrR family transcriptional regulator [Streptomyces lunaelactis]NUK24022.1 TetR/AcrR family transcriptional regulator [Streptomyces lunaelactis]NUK33393.1 TetR/AcrR family transcriptional regulator [Streptomyces lunaelactis]NUK42256.1 TetR/AcrR family transcriptional regulator [Streptomyces lunaelactis]
MAVSGKTTPRQRYRDQVRGEIKQAALEQIRTGGAPALSLNAVAKQLGVTGPALYKYFKNRDDLLTELICDAYDDAASAMRRAAVRVADGSPRERLHALGTAYRQWAVDAPHLYQLLAGTPSPSYQAPAETVERARAVLGPFLPVLGGGHCPPAAEELRAQMRRWLDETPAVVEWVNSNMPDAGADPDPATALAGTIIVWARLHGIVSLEVQGQFSGMGHRVATLVDAEMGALADSMGMAGKG